MNVRAAVLLLRMTDISRISGLSAMSSESHLLTGLLAPVVPMTSGKLPSLLPTYAAYSQLAGDRG